MASEEQGSQPRSRKGMVCWGFHVVFGKPGGGHAGGSFVTVVEINIIN